MNRKDFFTQLGVGAAALLVPVCFGGLAGCSKSASSNTTPSPGIDFTLDISSGALATIGGFLVSQGVLVARVNASSFIAVSAACTHQGTTINYNASGNNFFCPNHGARFDSSGAVTQGPATTDLKKYNTSLAGSSLRVFS